MAAPPFAVHGDDDGADEGGGEQQAHDFEWQDEAMHEGVADLLDGDAGCGGGWRGGWLVRMAQARTAKTAAAMMLPASQWTRVGGQLARSGAVGHHDGEDGEDGDGADVDHDLGEADELGVELEVERGDSGEADGEGEDAVDGVAQAHGGGGSGDGERARMRKATVILSKLDGTAQCVIRQTVGTDLELLFLL